jgi:L-threonylcarbamoyladenylate synthase
MNDEIKRTIEVLKKGGIILYPTDTIWGIGCDATNEAAVKRIYELKKRSDEKSMLVLVDSADKLPIYMKQVPEIAYSLIETTDTPLTIIYPDAENLAQNLISPDGTIGIRVAQDEFCKKLISYFKKPLVSTSANISGAPHPGYFDEISDEIRKGVDYIVNWRQSERKKSTPSAIIKLEVNGVFKIIRK